MDKKEIIKSAHRKMTLPRTSFPIMTGLMGLIGTTIGTFSLKQVLLSTFEKILENILISKVNLFQVGLIQRRVYGSVSMQMTTHGWARIVQLYSISYARYITVDNNKTGISTLWAMNPASDACRPRELDSGLHNSVSADSTHQGAMQLRNPWRRMD